MNSAHQATGFHGNKFHPLSGDVKMDWQNSSFAFILMHINASNISSVWGAVMSENKNLCLRLSYEEYVAFDTICKEKGYSKTGKIREFIRKLIKEELPSVKASAWEWTKIEAAIKEIERGEYLTLEELKK
jgi:predicted transcriptional regulator